MKVKCLKIIIVCFIAILFVTIGSKNIGVLNSQDTIQISKKKYDENLTMSKVYSHYVKTKNESKIYTFSNGLFRETGLLSKGVELELNGIVDKYFIIKNFDEKYLISYLDVEKIDELQTYDTRFNNYIVFNQNISTNDNTLLYDDNDMLVYNFYKKYDFPVIIKDDDRYGVNFNGRLLYVHKNDASIYEHHNTDSENISGVSVLNYHFFYDETLDSERRDCNQIICMSMGNFKKQLDYIKNNNFLTLKMKELEMYIDGKIQLPKSVLISIDDGWRAELGLELINEYKMNATMFLATAWYDVKFFESEYVEVHSHGDNIHNGGLCPGGQGGEIKCMEHDKLLADLKLSREKLHGTSYFCYPFYEYNDYSISVLKEAGYTMAFAGYYANGNKYVKPFINKYKLPRNIMYNGTSLNEFANYLNLK